MTDRRTRELSNDLVVAAARVIREIRRSHTEGPGASTRVLSLLDELGPATVSQLAEADRVSQPTMTGLLRGLADRGWLTKTPHPDDARSTLVGLSTEGRATLHDVRRRNAALVAERVAAAGHSPEDLATAVAVLRSVLRKDS